MCLFDTADETDKALLCLLSIDQQSTTGGGWVRDLDPRPNWLQPEVPVVYSSLQLRLKAQLEDAVFELPITPGLADRVLNVSSSSPYIFAQQKHSISLERNDTGSSTLLIKSGSGELHGLGGAKPEREQIGLLDHVHFTTPHCAYRDQISFRVASGGDDDAVIDGGCAAQRVALVL